ncbi:hypothetical protein GF312_14290 [Candidatus Poribacteria bacterium]|nr:hypothetical protein [Candidatus Poribacteria bacterium]
MLVALSKLMPISLLLIIIISIFNFSYAIEEEGLVLYFKFDELDGNILEDYSGNENFGTAKGIYELVEGKYDNGLMISGSPENYVEVADSDSLDITEVYSILLWVNFTEITGERHQFFFDKGADDKNPGGCRLGKLSTGELLLHVYKDGGWQPDLAVNNPAFETDRWFHIAITRDEAGEASLYIDGVKKSSSKDPAFALPANDNALMLWGSTAFGQNDMFIGIMDELAIFKNRALSEAEVRNFKETQSTPVQPSGKLSTTWSSIKENTW